VISARRVALMGLGAPVDARMIAVNGLWPEAATQPEQPVFGGRYLIPVPLDLREGFRRRLLAEDELMLLMAAAIVGSGLIH